MKLYPSSIPPRILGTRFVTMGRWTYLIRLRLKLLSLWGILLVSYVGHSYIDVVLGSLIYFPTSDMQLLGPPQMQIPRLIMEKKRKRQPLKPLELMPVLHLPSGILDFRTFVWLRVTSPS